jgi:hypothetical protein
MAGPAAPFPSAAIRGVRARSAPAAACGMYADVTVDFEPSAAGLTMMMGYGLVVAEAGTNGGTGGADVLPAYLEALANGITAELAALEPGLVVAARVVIRRVLIHPADSSAAGFLAAGRIVGRQALAAGRAMAVDDEIVDRNGPDGSQCEP